MTRSRKLLGMGFVVLVDAAAGSIIAQLCCLAFDRPITLLALGSGILFALLPDVSVVLMDVFKVKAKHHRDLTHYPLVIIPIFLLISFFSIFWATMLGFCLIAHFVDDTADPGGIKWFAPIWNKKFQVIAKEPEPLPREEWLERYYLRPTIKTVGGVVLAIASVSLFFFLLPRVDLLGY